MTDGILNLFPHASTDFLARNTGQTPKLESDTRPTALEPGKAEILHTGRVLVRVTSVRTRLIDEDNLCEKYHVDCCRYAGLILGDSPAQAQIQVSQRKTLKGEAEHTQIEIFALE